MAQPERLTARQEQILTFYQDRQRQTGFVPTLQETAKHFGFKSPNAVRQHLRLIEKKGFVHRFPGRSRALVVVRQKARIESDSVRVPLLGRIPAGNPTLAFEDTEGTLTLPASLFRGTQLFALRVRGSSMKDAGIFDGDIAVLDGKAEARDGMIAAILMQDETTLKRIYRQPKGILLKAENRAFRDIELGPDETERTRLMGVLVGIVRKI